MLLNLVEPNTGRQVQLQVQLGELSDNISCLLNLRDSLSSCQEVKTVQKVTLVALGSNPVASHVLLRNEFSQ